jgi:hypothetical protein
MIYSATYGSLFTPCTVYYHDGWYAVRGSINVNRTQGELYNGIDIETLRDYDMFTSGIPIESIEDLIKAIEG